MDTMEHSRYLFAKALTLFVNPLARRRYQEVSEKIGERLIKQKALMLALTERTGLKVEEIQDLIQSSATILSFSSLIGWDFGSRVSKLEGLKGAAIGATVGFCLVIGHVAVKIILRKHEDGFEVTDFKVEEEALDESVAAYS